MSVDISQYVPDLLVEINPPGVDVFPGATDDEWVQRLRNGFWEAYIAGFLLNFTESNGIITPNSGSVDITRDLVQVVIFFAAYTAITTQLRNLKTRVSQSAGPARNEFEQSAMLLTTVLKDLVNRRDILLRRLSDLGIIPTIVFDSNVESDFGLANFQIFFER